MRDIEAFRCSAQCAASPPGTGSTTATINALVFPTDDLEGTDAPFAGTEHLHSRYLFHGRPCPRDPPSRQHQDLMSLLGMPTSPATTTKFL